MSKSDDNTNELESYGVWVKNSAGKDDVPETSTDTSDELNLDAGGLDLPDFDDSDFSDMFKEEPQAAAGGLLDDFGSEDDTTLSTDELANITDGFEVEQVEAAGETDDLDLGDMDFGTEISEETSQTDSTDDIQITEETSSEEINFDDISTEEITTDEAPVEDVSFDIEEPAVEENSEEDVAVESEEVNFDIDEPSVEETPVIEDETSVESEEVSFGEDEEISLDDFMDGGFSDESVAAGNNGYEPGAEPKATSSETEELSLDDFMDGSSFDSAPAEVTKEEEIIEDEAPLDMDISFDDSADAVETEDNVSLDISGDDDETEYETEESESIETEEVSMDDFGSSFTAEESPAPSASSESINTEEVDLSDFGIDADAEETPIVQDVEEAKNKEKIVDYDLSVGDENTATAPVVNEIKSDATEQEVEEKTTTPVAEKEDSNTTSVDNSLLQQIVSELSSLKDEMNKLKSNIEEIKTHENTVSPAAAIAAGAAGVAAVAAVAAATEADEIPETKDEGGFFSDDDGDDTIALSFDELDNIMNTADFSETVEESVDVEETPVESEEVPVESEEVAVESEEVTEEPVIEDVVENEPVIEETAVEESEIELPSEEPLIEEETVEITEEEAPAFEELSSEDTVIEESIINSEIEPEDSESIDSEIENAVSTESDTSLDDINFDEEESKENLSFDFSDEKLEEPEIDEFIPDGNDELYENEELPDEISIPKEEDLLVESTSSDFMDSVKDTTEEPETAPEFIEEETIEDDTSDLPSELPEEFDLSTPVEETVEEEPIAEETVEEEIDDDIPTVDKLLSGEPEDEITADEPVFDESSVEESEVEVPVEEEIIEDTVVEDTIAEEPVVEEPQEPEQSEEVSFAEVDNLDNSLSESNLAYLDKQDDKNSDSIANTDLKQDIKSVLLYMDQLLENLPEDKIIEFAKSDEFVTYKKLFSELGLS